jgi:radical SAM superfamily enzyme YgiQ (UPF0313 family)
MREANFFTVFVGIETPDEAALVLTQKKQNTRRSIPESVRRIYDAGIFVIGGFIVGFDTETDNVVRGMVACIEEAAIPVTMLSLLYAWPRERRIPRNRAALYAAAVERAASASLARGYVRTGPN